MLIVDTGVIVAAADRKDSDHAVSSAIIRNDVGPLITTALVIAEAAYLSTASSAHMPRRH